MWCASAFALEDLSLMAVLIAGVCLVDTSSPVHAADTVAMLRIGSNVAARRKAHPPADYLAQAGTELAAAGVLADPQSFIAEVRSRIHEEDHNEAGTRE
jgi:hypothetical protein